MARTKEAIVWPRAQWVDLLEAIHAPVRDDAAWCGDVADGAAAIFPTGRVGVYTVDYEADLSASTLVHVRPAGMRAALENAMTSSRDDPHRLFQAHHFGPPVQTHGQVVRQTVGADLRRYEPLKAQLPFVDGVGIVAHPEPGRLLVLCVNYDRMIDLTAHERRLLTRIASHLENSYRARRRPETIQAEVTAGGRVIRYRDDAVRGETLQMHTGNVRRARSRSFRNSPEGLELWSALVDGRASLVPRPNGSYLVVDNLPATHAVRALTPNETAFVSLSARGLSTKLVAYALGVSPSVVSNGLASAAAKLGTASRLDLLRIAAILVRDPRAELRTEALTAAERDILTLVQRGLSNAEIAQARSRSIRTIANQVASLLRKTKSASRRGLIVAPSHA